MERPAGAAGPAVVPGVVVGPWDRTRDHERIPQVYAAAFGHEPWPGDWDRFDEFDPSGVFVAHSGGEAVGFAVCFLRSGSGYISVVAVVPSARRRGIASALVRTAMAHLESLGAAIVRIDAYEDAAAAVAAYRSLGFEVYEIVEDSDADPRGSAEE
jgi:mycothiol synthase